MNVVSPLAVTASTLVNACGRGQAATLDAIQKNITGLSQQVFSGVNFDTWLGQVAGIDSITLEPELAHYNCRNNRLARMALLTDDFIPSVEGAISRYGADRVGLFVGTSTSGIAETEYAYQYAQKHDNEFPDHYQLLYSHNIASLHSYIQQALGLHGPGHAISTACSSSAKVFAAAYRHIVSGQCDAAVVGGVDTLCLSTLYGFNSLQLVSNEICRPYDIHRKGINIGEAAGFALLESEKEGHGKVKFKGYGESSDAYHMSTPHPQGEGAINAMNKALLRAGIVASDIDYINLHGTATRSNDAAEAQGLLHLFGDEVVCSSTKGLAGHTLGAAGIVEAIISIMALEHKVVPGTLNLKTVDPDLAISPLKETEKRSVENVMTNNFGFGGSNCSLIFGW